MGLFNNYVTLKVPFLNHPPPKCHDHDHAKLIVAVQGNCNRVIYIKGHNNEIPIFGLQKHPPPKCHVLNYEKGVNLA